MRNSMAGMERRWVLVAFFLSGCAGLIYQSIWIRMLSLIVGGTTIALTTVLIAFMGGLALGSLLFGGLADRTPLPLKLYGFVEIAIGLYALGLPRLYKWIPSLYQGLHGLDPSHGLLFHFSRFGLALLVFGVPATLMGGTLPLVVKALGTTLGGLQVTVARLYAINTFGATLGAFLTGFVAIPHLGLRATLSSTALMNIFLGLAFWMRFRKSQCIVQHSAKVAGETGERRASGAQGRVGKHGEGSGSAGERGPDVVPNHAHLEIFSERRTRHHHGPIVLLVFFLMGASSLSYELLWHRLMSLSFGSSVYAVSTMLTTFLIGIATGSWWLKERGDRTSASWRLLAQIELSIALLAPLVAWVLTWIPHLVQYLFLLPYAATKLVAPGYPDAGFWLLQLALFGVGVVVMLGPTALMGASFPLAVRLYSQGEVGKAVGRVYASNTLGAIVGLALTGFLFIEWLGVYGTNLGWSLVNAAVGLGILLQLGRSAFRAQDAMLLGLIVCVLLLIPRGNLETLTSGVYYHVIELDSPSLRGEVIFHTEDDTGLISIHRIKTPAEPDPVLVVKVNGKFMAEDGYRLPVEQAVAHIPLLLRGEDTRDVFVIGLGGGYTAQAALQHPVRRVEVAEISRGVIDAAHITRPLIFEDPRLELVEEDARSLLLTGEVQYDVIISEASNPWMTGLANLYTSECFGYVHDRLAPGGVFGAWIPTKHKTLTDLRIILRGISRNFSHMAIFELTVGDLVVVASDEPLTLNAAYLKTRVKQLAPQLREINLEGDWRLMGRLALGDLEAREFIGEGPINTDDLPIIEFSTPRTLNIGLKGEEVWDAIVDKSPTSPPLALTNAKPWDLALWTAQRALHFEQPEVAYIMFQQARSLGAPEDPKLEGRILFQQGKYEEALKLAERMEPSLWQATLISGVLLRLGKIAALGKHLKRGDGWSMCGNPGRWERRLLHRRVQLAAGFGVSLRGPSPHCVPVR